MWFKKFYEGLSTQRCSWFKVHVDADKMPLPGGEDGGSMADFLGGLRLGQVHGITFDKAEVVK